MAWDVDGVKGEARLITLLYSEAAGVVLAHFERNVSERKMVRSLYVRNRDGVEYRRVFGEDEDRSAHDVVLSPRSTIALFTVLVARGETPGGYDVERIARLDLRTGLVSTALDMKTYAEKNDNGWIADLVAVEAGDTTVLCRTAAWQTPKNTDGHSVHRVDYWLSRVELDSAEVEHIAPLKNVAF